MTVSREKYLIVNADDFGLSPGVNRGIIEAHERGIVTSTSLMVRHDAAAEAAAYLRGHPRLGAGLHVDLGEWAFRGGEWVPVYEVVPVDDHNAVQREVERQLESFRRLVGAEPGHLDTHQHVHKREAARTILCELGSRLGVPVRHFTPGLRYCGEFYGQTTEGAPCHHAIGVEAMLGLLSRMEAGVTELACHPGMQEELNTMYRDERAMEVAVLCDPIIRAALSDFGIRLCSFGEARSATGSLVPDADGGSGGASR